MPSCREQILSDDYYDLISEVTETSPLNPLYALFTCVQQVNPGLAVLHISRQQYPVYDFIIASYTATPKCYALADVRTLEQAGIYQVQQYPGLELTGKDVLIGFVDTGIDYTSDSFRNPDGTTRIVGIWDQTDQTGNPPPGRLYGSYYSGEQINEALQSDFPLDIVPETDDIGHGTFMASVAAGGPSRQGAYLGAAPDSRLLVVKCKQAKEYLRRLYRIREGAAAFQENDLILGVTFLLETARAMDLPIVICLGMGTNQGDHNGNSHLGDLLQQISAQRRCAVVVASGNEANAGHHFYGQPAQQDQATDVEIRVDEGETGFSMELWAGVPDLYSVSVTSPSGEVLPRAPVAFRQSQTYQFLFERTRLQIDYFISETQAGDELIFLSFDRPAPGIWTVSVHPVRQPYNAFHVWLPVTEFLSGDTFFLRANPEVTLTEPSAVPRVITVGAYNGATGAIDIQSGRGYTRSGVVKPDLVAPGADVTGLLPDGRYGARTGTSISAAVTAGGAALLLEWAVTQGNQLTVDALDIKSYLIRGVDTPPGREYPNREWGYGTLNVYGALESLRIM